MTNPRADAVAGGELRLRALETARISDADRRAVHALFDIAYARANHAYLDRSLGRLRYIAIAEAPGGAPAGFALGDNVRAELPRVPGRTLVSLGGLSCVHPDYRRRGLWRRLTGAAHAAADDRPQPGEPRISTGRMAHPASFATMRRNPTVIPRGRRPLTPWQQEIARAVADLYGSRIDPATLATIGDGRPIGYPRMDVDATPEQWDDFRHVDRDRGDALLAISWVPAAPIGWDDDPGPEVARWAPVAPAPAGR